MPTKFVLKPILLYIVFHFSFVLQASEVNLAESVKQPTIQQEFSKDSIQEYKNLAKQYADSLQAAIAVDYATRYIRATQDLTIINDHFFSNINQTSVYVNFKERYKTEFDFLYLFYLFAGFLGFFIVIILNLRKGVKRSSTLVMSLFVLLHSLFIIHLSIYVINCQYYFPHTLLMSTVFILLYGPLIYFYFKMIDQDYSLKWKDGFHFLPALVLLIYIYPFYSLSSKEKFIILFDQKDILSAEANFIIAAQTISLILYAILIIRIYRRIVANVNEEKNRKLVWQRNLLSMYVIYVIMFILFNTTTSGIFDSMIVYHFLILTMVGSVFYVAYITYAQPEIFKGEITLVDPMSLFKYKKSGLTKSFSEELKDQLLNLLEIEKVYKQNDLNLNGLAEILGTNRHNTSQIINEHFEMSFFELINKFRIDEAVRMIHDEKFRGLNIIEIAYEVGYNNKVTFNKSFKKAHSVTPSQYIKSLNN
jgi:AraC-like DNA-binding protein